MHHGDPLRQQHGVYRLAFVSCDSKCHDQRRVKVSTTARKFPLYSFLVGFNNDAIFAEHSNMSLYSVIASHVLCCAYLRLANHSHYILMYKRTRRKMKDMVAHYGRDHGKA